MICTDSVWAGCGCEMVSFCSHVVLQPLYSFVEMLCRLHLQSCDSLGCSIAENVALQFSFKFSRRASASLTCRLKARWLLSKRPVRSLRSANSGRPSILSHRQCLHKRHTLQPAWLPRFQLLFHWELSLCETKLNQQNSWQKFTEVLTSERWKEIKIL